MHLYDNNFFYAALCLSSFLLQLVWVKFLPVQTEEVKSNTKKQLTDVVFCACLAFTVSTLFRLFPGSNRPPVEDSSVFLYIGKRMTEGKIPYLDLFDHKGPILYFIEYLGILISKTDYTGVWLLELFNILITVILMRKLGRITSDRASSVLLAVLLCAGICGWKIWQGGNFAEEYALPWITLAAVEFFLFFKTGSYRQSEIILLGVGFAVVFLLRANMIAIWAVLMPIVLIVFVKEKRFSDIIRCSVLFILGVATVLLPVLIYTLRTGSTEALWQDYIRFNISYTNDASSLSERLKLAVYFVKLLWPGVIAIIVTLIFHPEKSILWVNSLFFITSLWFVTMSGRGYYHYAIVLLPTFMLPCTEMFDMTDRLLRCKDESVSFCRPWLVVTSSFLILLVAFIYRATSSKTDSDRLLVKYIQEQTTEDDDVLILGNSCWYYLMTDRKTDNCYFYQLPPAEVSVEIYDDFIDELRKHSSRLVVLPGLPEERELVDIALKGIREKLFEMGYKNWICDEFEAFWIN